MITIADAFGPFLRPWHRTEPGRRTILSARRPSPAGDVRWFHRNGTYVDPLRLTHVKTQLLARAARRRREQLNYLASRAAPAAP